MPSKDTSDGYASRGVRYESRPDPIWASTRQPAVIGSAFRAAGVQARWISVVDPWGVPYYRSRWLPTTFTDVDEWERQLIRLIAHARRSGMALLSRYPLSLNKAAVQAHPDWAQQMLVDSPNPGVYRGIECCIHSGCGMVLAVRRIRLRGDRSAPIGAQRTDK